MLNWNHQSLLKAPVGRHKDPRGNHLSLKVTAGKKAWVWQARVAGVPRTITIGAFPTIGLADAREKAGLITADNANGVDVHARYGAGAKDEATRDRSVLTCQEAWDTWIAALRDGTNTHGRRVNKESTLSEKERVWKSVFKEALGDRLIVNVSEDDLLDQIDAVRDERGLNAANTAIRYVKAFFTWAKRSKRKTGAKVNPAADLAPSAVRSRSRFLNADEIRWLWMATEMETPIWRDGYRLALLAGQRRDEIFWVERAEVNERDRSLDIRAARMKNSLDHRVPVGPMAWAIIEERMRAHAGVHLFPSTRDGETDRAVSGYSKAQARVRRAVAKLAEAEGKTVEHWVFHDLRRTFSSGCNSLRDENENRLIAKDHVERCLSHVIGGVEGVYDRSDYFVEKRRAFQLWEAEVARIVAEPKK